MGEDGGGAFNEDPLPQHTHTPAGLADKVGTVVFLGVDNAGKTTLLSVLRDGRHTAAPPTYHATSQELTLGNLTIKAWDLGGHYQARVVWKT